MERAKVADGVLLGLVLQGCGDCASLRRCPDLGVELYISDCWGGSRRAEEMNDGWGLMVLTVFEDQSVKESRKDWNGSKSTPGS